MEKKFSLVQLTSEERNVLKKVAGGSVSDGISILVKIYNRLAEEGKCNVVSIATSTDINDLIISMDENMIDDNGFIMKEKLVKGITSHFSEDREKLSRLLGIVRKMDETGILGIVDIALESDGIVTVEYVRDTVDKISDSLEEKHNRTYAKN